MIRMARRAVAILGAFLALAQSWPAYADGGPTVTTLMPALSGNLDQGRGAAFVLKLQLQLNQFQRDTAPNCAGTSGELSHGVVAWIPGQLNSPGAGAARSLALLNGAQAVVWGTVSSYPDGALVSPFLTLIDSDSDLREVRPERQVVNTSQGAFVLRHPATTLAFDPVEIADRDLRKFNYSNLEICDDRNACRKLGDVYRITRVLGVDQKGGIRIRYESQVYNLSAKALVDARQSGFIRYVSALSAFLRGQENRAACGFSELARDDTQTTGVRANANYYLGLIALMRGQCPFGEFLRAYDENDASEVTARALVIAYDSSRCSAMRTQMAAQPATVQRLASASSVIRIGLAERPDPRISGILRRLP